MSCPWGLGKHRDKVILTRKVKCVKGIQTNWGDWEFEHSWRNKENMTLSVLNPFPDEGLLGWKLGISGGFFRKLLFRARLKRLHYILTWRENIILLNEKWSLLNDVYFDSVLLLFFPKALKIAIQSKVCNWRFWLLHGWDLFIWNLIECQPHGKSSNSGQAHWRRY